MSPAVDEAGTMNELRSPDRTPASASGRAALLAICLLGVGCAVPAPVEITVDDDVYARAAEQARRDRSQRLEREVERLRQDLKQAEDALIAAESGLRGARTRADAVSALAEARIEVERARSAAPWRQRALGEAESKLEEGDRHARDAHFGTAIFFASRAERIAEALLREARMARRAPNTRWVSGRRVNLRSGPSTEHAVIAVLQRATPVVEEKVHGDWALVRSPLGEIGWIYRPLLSRGS